MKDGIFLVQLLLVLFLAGTSHAQVLQRTEFFFPQLADGKIADNDEDEDEFRTTFVLNNPNDSVASGKLALFSDNGSPLVMRFRDLSGNIVNASEINFTIAAKGVFQIATAGQQNNLVSGYGKVTSNIPIAGMSIFGEFEIDDDEIEIESQAAVEATGALRAFTISDFRAEESATGLAIVNTSRTSGTTITLTEFDPSGNQVDQVSFFLGAGAHRAFFLSQLLSRAPRNMFIGSVIAQSSDTDISAIALKFDDEDDGDEFTVAPVIQIR